MFISFYFFFFLFFKAKTNIIVTLENLSSFSLLNFSNEFEMIGLTLSGIRKGVEEPKDSSISQQKLAFHKALQNAQSLNIPFFIRQFKVCLKIKICENNNKFSLSFDLKRFNQDLVVKMV